MASIGHPIYGDLFYAPAPVYRAADRLLLHADELRVLHPRTGAPMRFVAPCPFSIDDVEG
jgi:tRNA pseudouridine32 synthase/23S rRNA pseudouridine746 synthase